MYSSFSKENGNYDSSKKSYIGNLQHNDNSTFNIYDNNNALNELFIKATSARHQNNFKDSISIFNKDNQDNSYNLIDQFSEKSMLSYNNTSKSTKDDYNYSELHEKKQFDGNKTIFSSKTKQYEVNINKLTGSGIESMNHNKESSNFLIKDISKSTSREFRDELGEKLRSIIEDQGYEKKLKKNNNGKEISVESAFSSSSSNSSSSNDLKNKECILRKNILDSNYSLIKTTINNKPPLLKPKPRHNIYLSSRNLQNNITSNSPTTSVTDISSTNTCTPQHKPHKLEKLINSVEKNDFIIKFDKNLMKTTTTFGSKTVKINNQEYDNIYTFANKKDLNTIGSIERRNYHVKNSEC
jgi:hypothetical protein